MEATKTPQALLVSTGSSAVPPLADPLGEPLPVAVAWRRCPSVHGLASLAHVERRADVAGAAGAASVPAIVLLKAVVGHVLVLVQAHPALEMPIQPLAPLSRRRASRDFHALVRAAPRQGVVVGGGGAA